MHRFRSCSTVGVAHDESFWYPSLEFADSAIIEGAPVADPGNRKGRKARKKKRGYGAVKLGEVPS